MKTHLYNGSANAESGAGSSPTVHVLISWRGGKPKTKTKHFPFNAFYLGKRGRHEIQPPSLVLYSLRVSRNHFVLFCFVTFVRASFFPGNCFDATIKKRLPNEHVLLIAQRSRYIEENIYKFFSLFGTKKCYYEYAHYRVCRRHPNPFQQQKPKDECSRSSLVLVCWFVLLGYFRSLLLRYNKQITTNTVGKATTFGSKAEHIVTPFFGKAVETEFVVVLVYCLL